LASVAGFFFGGEGGTPGGIECITRLICNVVPFRGPELPRYTEAQLYLIYCNYHVAEQYSWHHATAVPVKHSIYTELKTLQCSP